MQTLDKIHGYGVIHRDITPENIKFTDDREKEVRLIDFGSARDMMDEVHTAVLTDGYAPVEQYSGYEQGPWTDIYALCAVIYQGITGQKPQSSILRAAHDDLLMPSQLGIVIDARLEKILKKGLQVRKERRYQTVEEMLAELEPLIAPPKKKKHSKKEKIFLAASCVVFVLAVGAAVGWNYYQEHQAYFKFHGKRTETVLLAPYDDMGSQDYKKDTETIQKRLNYIAGEDGYILKEKEDGLEITMPLEFFQENDPEYKDLDYDITKTIRRYLSEPQRLALSLVGESESGGSEGEYWRIDREDIVSVKRKDGKMPVESKMPEEYASDTEYDSYLEIKITEDAAKKIQEKAAIELQKLEGWDLYTILITDPGDVNRSKLQIDTDFDGDWTTYYMECNKSQKWWKALFKTSELSEAFQIVQEIPVDWEEKNGMWGKYQCRESEIQEPSVTTKYEVWLSSYGDDELREGSGEWTEVMYDLKKKLDILEIPYAIGMSPDKGKKIMIKTAQKDSNIFLRKAMLGGGFLALSAEDPEIEPLNYINGKLDISETSYGLQFTTESDTQKKNIQEWLKQVLDAGESKVYLWLNGYRIAWTEAESADLTALEFSNSCLEAGKTFEKEELPFLKFVCEVYNVADNKGYSYDSYAYSKEQYSAEKQKVTVAATVQNDAWMPETEEFEEAEKLVKKIRPEASVRESRSSVDSLNLYIHLKYDLKKAYANKMVSDTEKLLGEGTDLLKKYAKIYIVPDDKETGSYISIKKNEEDGKWTLKYVYESSENEDERQVREAIRNSTVLKPYLTEDSLKEDMGWWWFNYDFLR